MVSELSKRVIRSRRKRAVRLKKHYYLAKSYGYTAEEAAIIMNQSWKTIIINAHKEDRKPPCDMPEEYHSFVVAISKALDVTNEGGD
jgi:hypothetical protein